MLYPCALSKKSTKALMCLFVCSLELAKQIAIKNENANSLVTAVMAQAKLLGIEGGNMRQASHSQSQSQFKQRTLANMMRANHHWWNY